MHDRIPYHCPEKKIPKGLRRSTQITPGTKAKMVKVIIHPEKTNLIWCHGNIHQLHKYYNPYLNIVDEEFFESIRHNMSCFLVGSITNVWHLILTLEPSADSVVNTFWFPPAGL